MFMSQHSCLVHIETVTRSSPLFTAPPPAPADSFNTTHLYMTPNTLLKSPYKSRFTNWPWQSFQRG
jgi:hypothetical protein